MSNEDRRILTICGLTGSMILATQMITHMMDMRVWPGLLMPITFIATGTAVMRIYRMGIETGREEADNATQNK